MRALRDWLGMECPQFVAAFGVAVKTVRDWESGRRHPDGTARSYLAVITAEPELVKSARAKKQALLPTRNDTAALPSPLFLKTGSNRQKIAKKSGSRFADHL